MGANGLQPAYQSGEFNLKLRWAALLVGLGSGPIKGIPKAGLA